MRVVSVTENVDDSISGQLVENIMASLAEFYSANLGEEVRKGLAECVKQGSWPHGHPVGYRRGKLNARGKRPIELDREKAPKLRWVFEAISAGQHRISQLEIWLQQHGVKLAKSHLYRMLGNPFYCGRMVWNGKTYLGCHPPLVPEELFERVQVILRERQRPWNRGNGWGALLHMLARCHLCDSLVSTDRVRRKNIRYYRCRSSSRSNNPCPARVANAKVVDTSLENLYRGLLITASVKAAVLRLHQERKCAVTREDRYRQEILSAQRANLQIREARLAEALAEGFLDPELYRLTVAKIRHEALESQIQQEKGGPVEDLQMLRALDDAANVLDVHLALPVASQRLLVSVLFSGVWIDHTGVVRYELNDAKADLPAAAA